MNMYRVEERKNCLIRGLSESSFNLNYLEDMVIDKPSFNKFSDIIVYENDIHFLMNIYSKLVESGLEENKLSFLENQISNQIKYMNNIRYVKSILENTQSYLQRDLSKLIEEADTMISADRILSNETRLDEKFNINDFINKYNTYSENSIISLIEELCFMIDTFNCDSKLKYNTALENITYSLYNHKINISEELIVETVTRFFELTGLDTVSVLENTSVINEKVKHKVLYNLKSKSVSKVKELIDKIKKIKNPQQVKSVIRVLYSQSAEQVIEDTPNVLTWLRTFFMFSTVMINPYLGCIIMLVDQFIALDVKRSEADKMLNKFKSEKEKCEKKLDKLSNEKSKENLKKYIKEIDKSIDKLQEYRDSLHSEEELERKYDDDYNFDESTYIESKLNPILEYRNIRNLFEDVQSIVNTLPKNDLYNICNGTFKDSPHVKYRYIYKENGEPIGFIDCCDLYDNGEYSIVTAVKNGYRSKGIAEKMLNKAMKNTSNTLIWKCDKDNISSNSVAKKCGFKLDKSENCSNYYILNRDKKCKKERRYNDNMEGNFMEQNREYMDILFEGEYGYTPYNMTAQCFLENYISEFNSQVKTFKRNLKNYSLPKIVKEFVSVKDTDVNLLEYLLDNGNIYLPIAEVSSNIPENQFERLKESLSKNINMHYKIVEENMTPDITTLYLLTDYCITEQNIPHKDLVKTFVTIKETTDAMNNILENGKISKIFNDKISLVDNDYVRDISKVSNHLFSINNEEAIEILKETKEELYKKDKIPYALIENYNDAITILNNKSTLDDLYDFINVSECINNIIDINEQIITEGGLTNTLLMAREKLRKNVVKLSDKDKEYSRRIDNSMGNMIEKIQKNLTNKNREAVIKGSILPSASAALKLALASGAAALVNPVLSIIVLLGGLGCAKIGTAKEKQYILDEIEIELKLVDKKIQLAERNDDTKALEQLYRIEKQLKREKTRIKYNQKSFRPVDK